MRFAKICSVLVLAASVAAAHADTLQLRDGSLVEGQYAGGTGDVVQFTVGDQARYFPVGTVARLVVSERGGESGPSGGEAATPPDRVASGDAVTLRLRDGSVFKGVYRGGTVGQAYFQVFDEVRSFAVAQVAAIEFVPPPATPPPAATPLSPPAAGATAPPPAAAPAPPPASAPSPAAAGKPPRKLYFGAGFGLGFGDLSWFELWPVVGYRLTSRLTVGMEFLYRVREDDRADEEITATDYGAAPFVRLNLFRGLFVQAEYERLSYEFVDSSDSTDRDNYDSLLLGAGLARPMGGHASFVVSAFYNFSYSDDDIHSPYDEPWTVNAGIGFGF